MRHAPLLGSSIAMSILTAAAPASAEDWRWLMESETVVAAVDVDSIRRDGDVVGARLLTVPLGEMPPGGQPALMLFDMEIDCRSALRRAVGRRMTDLAGHEVQPLSRQDSTWAAIAAGTPAAALNAVLCHAAPTGPQAAPNPSAFARLVRPGEA